MPEYMYIAHFEWEEESKAFNVSFPDLPGCFTFGEDITESIHMAKDALEGFLLVSEDTGEDIPNPRSYQEYADLIKGQDFIQYIEADTDAARRREEQKSVNKMVTLPGYLAQLGKEKDVNFSALLQKALREELNLDHL